MNQIIRKINEYTLLSFLILGVFPVLEIAKVAVPLQYAFIPFMFLGLILALFGWLKTSHTIQIFFLLWVIVLIEVIISSVFGPMFKFDVIRFPTDIITYLSKMAVFLFLAIYFYNIDRVSADKFIKYFLIVLMLGMLVGVFQWLPWSGAAKIADAYTYRDEYVEISVIETLFKRIPGIAGMATSNGGIAVFSFVVAVSNILLRRNNYLLSLFVIMLAIFNIFASQSRMGYLTLVFSVFVFYGLWIYLKKTFFKPTVFLLSGTAVISGIIYYLFLQGNAFLLQAIERWLRLGDQLQEGGNRIGKIQSALTHVDGFYDYIFGISRFVQQSYGNIYIEVEPVNIFVLFGIVGFILQYLIIIVLLLYFFRHLKHLNNMPAMSALTVASFTGLLSYQFFSLAYFFFRETHVGLFPWILFGTTVGLIEKQLRIRRSKIQSEIDIVHREPV